MLKTLEIKKNAISTYQSR